MKITLATGEVKLTGKDLKNDIEQAIKDNEVETLKTQLVLTQKALDEIMGL